MLISYQVSEDDFVKAARLMLKKRSGITLLVLPWIGGTVLLAVSVEVAKSLYLHESPFAGSSMWQVTFGVTLPIILLLLPRTMKKQLRTQYRNTAIVGEPRTLQADFSGLHFRSKSSSSEQAWTNYVAYAEDLSSFLLIQQGNMLFIPIPKRELSPSQVEEVRSTFETYLPRK